MKHLSIAGLSLLATILVSVSSDAGTQSVSRTCIMNPDNSGLCYGSFYSFRNSPVADSAVFTRTTSGGYGQFYATEGGISYSCLTPTSGPVYDLFPVALANRGFFYISWDTTGTCSFLQLANGSQYQNVW